MTHDDYPALYRSADALSLKSQNRFFRVLFAHLLLLLIATGISVINSAEPALAVVQAVVLICALACAVYLFFVRPERFWYGGRAVAESIKTSTWRYVSRAEPFNDADAIDNALFSQKLRVIVEQNKDIAQRQIEGLEGAQVSPEMARIRALSLSDRIEHYIKNRIREQQVWYAKKAKNNQSVVNGFFLALCIVLLVAIVLAITKVWWPAVAYWPTDIFVTLAASLLAWMQAKRFQELSASYALAAHEISFIREQAARITKEEEFSDFVGDAENAFSREHTQWVARKDT